jgi:hypothetical protein
MAGAQEAPPVEVKVSVESVGKATLYHYRVVNSSAQPVTALQIGFDYYHGDPELTTAPAGWSPGDPAPSSAASPAGWVAAVNATEDSPKLDLEWRASEPAAAILPGQSLNGFSVVVPGSDASYSSAHWTVALDGAGASAFSAPLGIEKFCPAPRSAVAASPPCGMAVQP